MALLPCSRRRRSPGIAGRLPGAGAPARLAALATGLACIACLAGCAGYSAKMVDLRPQLATGDFAGALATIDKGAGGKDVLLAGLERGLVLRHAGRFAESNEAFAAAERNADAVFSRSLAEGAVALLTSDANVAYRPRPYEMAMVPFYKALNYGDLGQPGEAVVEARRASQVLARHVDATLGAVREQDRGDLEKVRNDAFMLWLSGMLYEADGETNDAFIAYRNAAVAFEQNAGLLGLEAPPALAGDLARTADRLGFVPELAQARQASPSVFAACDDTTPDLAGLRAASRRPAGQGELVLVVETGYMPPLVQERVDFPVYKGQDDDDRERWGWSLWGRRDRWHAADPGGEIAYWLSVAAPALEDASLPPFAGVRASAGTLGGNAVGVRAADLGRAARVTFDAEKPTIMVRTMARGLAKYLAARGAGKLGKGAGFLANLWGAATAQADTRSWLTLPRQVYVVRLSLPPGPHEVRIELLDAGGRVAAERTIHGVVTRPGAWTFASHRVF